MGRNIEDIIGELLKRRADQINAKAERLALKMLGEADSLAGIRATVGLTQAESDDLSGTQQKPKPQRATSSS